MEVQEQILLFELHVLLNIIVCQVKFVYLYNLQITCYKIHYFDWQRKHFKSNFFGISWNKRIYFL